MAGVTIGRREGSRGVACRGAFSSLNPSPSPVRACYAGSPRPSRSTQTTGSCSRDELCAAIAAGCDAVVCMLTDTIDEAVLDEARAQECRVFANMAVGFDNIDVDAATRRGRPGHEYSGGAHRGDGRPGLGACCWRVARRGRRGRSRRCGSGRFTGWGPMYMLGGDVTGRTLGLVGPGRIAAAVAERARGFGMPLALPRTQCEPRTRGPRRPRPSRSRRCWPRATSSACTSRSRRRRST